MITAKSFEFSIKGKRHICPMVLGYFIFRIKFLMDWLFMPFPSSFVSLLCGLFNFERYILIGHHTIQFHYFDIETPARNHPYIEVIYEAQSVPLLIPVTS